ncbi:FGGY-family carbohydrate kinase [Streptomyces sp. SID13031]|uniref:xylulokinase n=1 Tax=Streptomyces sp. SID13031 TaxID=2706046 RepID=UPI001EF1D07C|nr:FGGY-family carbohydrate kinase [Streptomyces sp. SID13031]
MLGIDIGTTAVKVILFDPAGRPVRAHTTAYGIRRPQPGWAEQDPLDWWLGCQAGIRAVLDGVPVGAVKSTGVVSQVNTHVFTDDDLVPLGPAIIWQDQRCAAVASELDARLSAADKERIWGGPVVLDASFAGARAVWFAREEPEKWARTRWVLSPKDFVLAKLTGQVATDMMSGTRISRPDGYLTEAVALADGLAERLPPIHPPESVLGEVHGLGTVVVGTMDAYGAIFGSRTTEPGRGMISCGTSLVVAGASRKSLPSAGIVTFPARNGLSVHAGPTQAAGDAIRWWGSVSGLSVADVFASARQGRTGPVFTPYLAGERAPLWDPDVRASFLGLSSGTTQADLSRAVLEGVAMSGRHVLEAVEQACGATLSTLTLSGGGARDDLWSQIHADVLGRPVERLLVHDSAALGAALLGAVGNGIFADVETAAAATVRVDRTFTPAAGLDPQYEVYRLSYEALRGIHERLSS